jgi:hypothetical protein
VEVEADPEHEQGHPYLGHLLGQVPIGHEPGVCGPTTIPASVIAALS